MTRLQAKLRVPLAKNILRALEAINEEGILQWDENGLSTMLVDGNRFKMLRVVAPADTFIDYSYVGLNPIRVGVIFSRMGQIIKTLTAKDELVFTYENDRFYLQANGIQQNIKLLRLDLMHEVTEWPSLDHTYDATIPGKEANDFLKTSGKNLTFVISSSEDSAGSLQWNTGSGDEAISWIPINQQVTGTIGSSQFTTEEVKSALTAAPKEDLTLRGSADSPIEFQWTFENINMTALVAPRK